MNFNDIPITETDTWSKQFDDGKLTEISEENSA